MNRLTSTPRNIQFSSPNTQIAPAIKIAVCIYLCLSSQLIAASPATAFQPFDTRDQNLFNLIHGQALPTNASLLKKSQSLWSSSLVITNTLNIESINQEHIYLDYEAYRFNLSYQYGINTQWNIKIDIPVIHQTGGLWDSPIDNWHQFFGMPRANRPFVEDNRYTIRYSNQSQTQLEFDDSNSTLGDIQIAVARSLLQNNNTTLSLWSSLKLPTGNEAKLSSNGAIDIAAWLAINQRLSDHWMLNVNAGAVVLGANHYQHMPLSDYAFYGHAMLGWSVSESIDLKLQLQGHSSYYQHSELKILGDSYFLTFGGSININSCNQLDFALSEDIKVEASPDVSFIISWRHYTSNC